MAAGALDLFLARNAWLILLVVIAGSSPSRFAVLMSRSDRLNRAFDRSFPLTSVPATGDWRRAGRRRWMSPPSAARDRGADQRLHLLRRDRGGLRRRLLAHAGADGFWVAVSAVSEDVAKPEGRFVVNAAFDPGLSLLRRLRHRPDEARFKELTKVVGASSAR